VDRLGRACFLLWLALLAFGLPEVIIGSSLGWVGNPFSYLVTIPLYALHFLLLVQVAIRSGRTSWSALYLLGFVFGLYEAWITKVVWAGYPGSGGFALGGFGPHFGIHETLGLVLFYHPVMSFLAPLAVMTRLFPAWAAVFPGPDWLFGVGRWAALRRWSLVALIAALAGLQPVATTLVIGTWLPFLAGLLIGYPVVAALAGRAARHGREVTGPDLGRTGIVLAAVALAALYLAGYRGILPERLPPPWVQGLTALAYPLLGALVLATKRRASRGPAMPTEVDPRAATMPARLLLVTMAVGFVLSATPAGTTGLGLLVGRVGFVALIPLGAGLFTWLGLWRSLHQGRGPAAQARPPSADPVTPAAAR